MDGMQSDDNKTYYLLKEFKFNNFLESQNFINKVEKYLKKKATIQISLLVGDMLK